MKTKFSLRLLARLALCATSAVIVWACLEAVQVAPLAEGNESAPNEMALANLAKVPVAVPWLLQLSALLRGR